MSNSILQDFYNASIERHGISEQPVWSTHTNSWIVFHPTTASAVLRSNAFSVVKHHEEIDNLQRERCINVMMTVQSSGLMPLSHDGPKHRELKRHATQVIHSVTGFALEKFALCCDYMLAQLLDNYDRFDIVEDLVLPISANLFSSMTGINEREFLYQRPTSHCASQLLTSSKNRLSSSRWKSINACIAERQNLVSGGPFEKLMLGSFSLITFEIFRAAIANSLIEIFSVNAGIKINQMKLPDQLPSTSIPFIDRVCSADTEFYGRTIRNGDKVLLYIGGASDNRLEQRKLFFGTGPHICIGKALTEAAWSSLVSILRKREEVVNVINIDYRDFDVVLIAPRKAELEVRK